MSPPRVQLFGGADDASVLEPLVRVLASIDALAEVCTLACPPTPADIAIELPATIDPLDFHEQLLDRMSVAVARRMHAALPDAVVLAPRYAQLVAPHGLPPHPRTLVLVTAELPDPAALRTWLASRATHVAAWRAQVSAIQPREVTTVRALRFAIEDS